MSVTQLADGIDKHASAYYTVQMPDENEVNQIKKNHNSTPLHRACIQLQPSMIESLLKKQTDVNANDIFGATPLHYAVLYQALPKETYVLVANLRGRSRPHWRHSQQDDEELYINGYSRNMPNNDQQHYVYCRMMNTNESLPPVLPGEDVHVAVITALLDGGADVLARDHNGRTPLHIVASLGYDKIAAVLLSRNANPNAQDMFGVTPLREAVDNSQHAIMDLLIEHSASVNAVDILGDSAMHAAVRQNNWPALLSCMKSGAIVDLQNKYGNTPLHIVENSNFRHMTYYLVRYGKVSLNIPNWLGQTVLHNAVLRGQNDLVEYLCRIGSNPNIADNYGNTSLHITAGCNIGSILLSYAADVKLKNKRGLTPLHLACGKHLPDFTWISCLLEAGAEVNACDLHGATALHFLANRANDDHIEQYLKIFEQFHKLNADFNVQTRGSRKTPLHLLCENPNATEGLFEYVLSISNPSVTDSLERTWAHCIADCRPTGSWQSRSRFSIANEINKDVCGLTPRFILISKQKDQFKALFEDGHVNDFDNFGRTMLSVCLESQLQMHTTTSKMKHNMRELASYKDFMGRNFLHHWSMKATDTSGVNSDVLKELFCKQINERDNFGRTPLYYAALYQRNIFVKVLVEAGADRSIGDNQSVLPFEIAPQRMATIPLLTLESNSISTKVVKMARIFKDHNPESINESGLFSYVKKKWERLQNKKPPTNLDDFNKENVTIFVETVMSEVAALDIRFESSQIMVGSAHQGTRTTFPGDYDFLITLNVKDVKWLAEESTQFPGSVRLKTYSTNVDEFVDQDRILQPNLLKDKLYCLLVTVMSRPTVWKAGLFEPLKVELINEMKSPAITMTLFQNPLVHDGKVIVCHHAISVDFVLAIRTDFQLPEKTPVSQFLAQNNYGLVDRSAFAVMKSPKYLFGCKQNGLCTKTFSLIESEIISRSSTVIKAAYMMLVGLITKRHALHKYMLATCLLSCIVNGKFDHLKKIPKTEMDDIYESFTILLTSVVKAVVNDAVESITCPGRSLPVFEFEPHAMFSKRYLERFRISYVNGFKYNSQETDEEIRRGKQIGTLIYNSGKQMRHVFTDPDNATLETMHRITGNSKRLRDLFRQLMGMWEEEFDEWIDELTEPSSSVDNSSIPLAKTECENPRQNCSEINSDHHHEKISVMYDYERDEGFHDGANALCYSKSPFKHVDDPTLGELALLSL